MLLMIDNNELRKLYKLSGLLDITSEVFILPSVLPGEVSKRRRVLLLGQRWLGWVWCEVVADEEPCLLVLPVSCLSDGFVSFENCMESVQISTERGSYRMPSVDNRFVDIWLKRLANAEATTIPSSVCPDEILSSFELDQADLETLSRIIRLYGKRPYRFAARDSHLHLHVQISDEIRWDKFYRFF